MALNFWVGAKTDENPFTEARWLRGWLELILVALGFWSGSGLGFGAVLELIDGIAEVGLRGGVAKLEKKLSVGLNDF